MNHMLLVLRDVIDEALEVPDDQESTPEEREAFLAGLLALTGKHLTAIQAKAVHAKVPPARRREVPCVLTAFPGAWQIVNTSPNFYAIPIGVDGTAPVPSGESFADFDPRDALADKIESGELTVWPEGLYDSMWREVLSEIAWQRRCMSALGVRDVDAARACLPHVGHTFALNARARIDLIEAEPTPAAPQQQYAKRLRASDGAQ